MCNFESNIASAKCNFKLGYAPTHAQADRWASWAVVAAKNFVKFDTFLFGNFMTDRQGDESKVAQALATYCIVSA